MLHSRVADVEDAVADGQILASKRTVGQQSLLDEKVRLALGVDREAHGANGQQENPCLHLHSSTPVNNFVGGQRRHVTKIA